MVNFGASDVQYENDRAVTSSLAHSFIYSGWYSVLYAKRLVLGDAFFCRHFGNILPPEVESIPRMNYLPGHAWRLPRNHSAVEGALAYQPVP